MQGMKQNKVTISRRRLGLTACAALIALSLAGRSLITQGETISSFPPEFAPPTAVSTEAQNFVATMPDFRGGQILKYTPIFAPRSSQVFFYEAKVVDSRLQDKGFMILEGNGKVVQFATEGPSKYDQLRAKTSSSFKMVRLGPKYFAAEDLQGAVVAGLGSFPTLRINNETNELLVTPRSSSTREGTTGTGRLPDLSLVRQYSSKEEAYHDYAANFDKYFINLPRTAPSYTPMMMKQDDPDGPDGGGGGGGSITHEAIGHANAFRFKQLTPDDPLNEAVSPFQQKFASGCGGTAWLNIFGWHDLNWTPSLLEENNFTYGYLAGLNSTNQFTHEMEAKHSNALAKVLGTFQAPFSSMGGTFPWDMPQGIDYAKDQLNHRPLVSYTWALPFDGDAALLAFESIYVFGKPVIIGYWSDIHYDVAYKHFGTALYGYYYIDKDDSSGEWVHGDDLFFAAVAYDFRPANNRVKNGSFEAGFSEWRSSTNVDAITVALKTTQAAHGTAYCAMRTTQAGTHRIWNTLHAPSGPHTLSAKIKTTYNAPGIMRLRLANCGLVNGSFLNCAPWELTAPPTGQILGEVAFNSFSNSNWSLVQLPPIALNMGEVVVEFVYTSPAGGFSGVLIDNVKLSPSGS